MSKITREKFDKLYSPDILKREYELLICDIDERFSEVVKLIRPNITKDRGWFDYGNCNYDNDGDSNGEFQLRDYKTEIAIGGECSFPEPYCFSDEGSGYIPTRWLWTDDVKILEEYNKEVDKCKEEKLNKKQTDKQKREEKKILRAKFKEIIQSKLTKEELKYVSFK
jgi:hypothetical protein